LIRSSRSGILALKSFKMACKPGTLTDCNGGVMSLFPREIVWMRELNHKERVSDVPCSLFHEGQFPSREL
jgi:hypothetical protein